jgi:hypothetical protein
MVASFQRLVNQVLTYQDAGREKHGFKCEDRGQQWNGYSSAARSEK